MGIYTCFILDYPKQPYFPWNSCPTQSKPSLSGGNTSACPDFGRRHLCHSPALHLSWSNIKTVAREPGADMDPFPCPHAPTETWHGGSAGEQLSSKTHISILMKKTPSKTIFLSIWKRFALIDASNKSNELCHNAGLHRLISYSRAQIFDLDLYFLVNI